MELPLTFPLTIRTEDAAITVNADGTHDGDPAALEAHLTGLRGDTDAIGVLTLWLVMAVMRGFPHETPEAKE